MKKINALIIDDERDSRELLAQYLSKISEVAVAAEAHSVQSGLQAILEHKPDLVFLDVQLQDGTGFDLLSQLPDLTFGLVFVTAHDHYAVSAIKHQAIDYLLKPIDKHELQIAVNRFLKTEKNEQSQQLKHLLDNLLVQTKQIRISLPTLTGFKLVDLTDIYRLESDGNYTKFYFEGGREMLVSKTLKHFENSLPKAIFCRIHHSHIININFIEEYIKGRGGQVILTDGTALNVSANRKGDLLRHWE